jgi:RimJ/RimL family protein N-acetyltransferase
MPVRIEARPYLSGERVILQPLQPDDFEKLYAVASDPLIWEQHPNKDRYKREVFQTFFEGALQSGGAYLVLNKETGEVIGSTRFYDFNPAEASIFIGYTFLARNCWGSTYNHEMKTLMLNYTFRFMVRVYFHIGAQNIRSQKAIERLGAEKVGEQEVTYHGETPKHNFVYCITKTNWMQRTNQNP